MLKYIVASVFVVEVYLGRFGGTVDGEGETVGGYSAGREALSI